MPRHQHPITRTLAGRPFNKPGTPGTRSASAELPGTTNTDAPLAEVALNPPIAGLAPLAGTDQRMPGHSTVRDLLSRSGMPAERAARVAARMAFVDMKRSFMEAAARITGPHGDTVRRKLRSSEDPLELFHLREVVAALLPEEASDTRRQLRQKLLTVFSDTTTGTPRDF